MACIKSIAGTLFSLWKTAHASVFAQFIEALHPSGQKLVRVGLMPHIPDNLILWQVKDEMHCHCKLYDSQV